ncbi:MAG: hypothetical protein COB05_05345 [Marinobacter sp.]|nr:MAG: hypothetical protein COB05_05345 [Marinobacter sp.]
MTEELKPCPFCGGEAEMMGDLYPYVECQKCAVNFSADHSYNFDFDDAARKWNARAQGGEARPVAWTWVSGGRHVTADKPYADQLKADGIEVRPLYTHPPKAQGVPEGWTLQCREGHPKTINIYRSKDGAWCGGGVEGEAGKSGLRYEFLKALLSTTPPADKPERGWVKPEDQLPELTGWYCVALADPDDIGWSTSVSWVAFWNGDDFEECGPIEDGQPVTHWMPLPKPPAAPDMGGEK